MAKRRTKRKPFDPAADAVKREKALAAERRKLRDDGIDVQHAEVEGVEISHAREAELEAKGVSVTLNHRRRMIRGHKTDVWGELHSRGRLTTEQHSAIRHLQDLMARRAGVGGRNEARSFDDAQIDEPLRDPCLVTDDMLRCGLEMDITLKLVGPPSSRLLSALLWPAALCEDYDWRAVVAQVTGETHAHAQAAPLRMAAQALVDVQDDVAKAMVDHAKSQAQKHRFMDRYGADLGGIKPFEKTEPVMAR